MTDKNKTIRDQAEKLEAQALKIHQLNSINDMLAGQSTDSLAGLSVKFVKLNAQVIKHDEVLEDLAEMQRTMILDIEAITSLFDKALRIISQIRWILVGGIFGATIVYLTNGAIPSEGIAKVLKWLLLLL